MPTTSPLTTIGNENYLMHRSYVAHDCLIGDHVKFAMVVSIGGHSIIGDYAYVGMHVGVHQRTSIGIHAMVGMGSAIVKNVPPYATIVCGRFTKINGYGLRLRAFTDDQIAAIESEYGFRDAPPVKGMDDVLGPIRDFRKIEGKTYEPCSS
jgi:UDP-N-acetylglucosamine acyltransferase